MNREINAADAFVAAWLPGSEGGGIADVLLRKPDGSVQHDFTGKLSFSWPRTATQYANNVGQKDYDPLFAFGFGLTYADKGDLAALPEVSGVTGEEGAAGVFFARGDAGSGIALRLEDSTGQGVTVTKVPEALENDLLKVTGVDHLAQEDGRRLAWSGKGEAVAALQSHTAPDLQRESNGDLMLLTTLRIDAGPQGDAWISVGCGAGCTARVAIGPTLTKLPVGQWTRVGVPLKCLADAGADVGKLDRPWSLATAGAMTISVSRVALGALNEAEATVACAGA
ncbi:hypothetical protein D3C71_1423810 [compost metagenome]